MPNLRDRGDPGQARYCLALLLLSGMLLAFYLGRLTRRPFSRVFVGFLEGDYPFLSVFLLAMLVVHLITLRGRSSRYLLYAAVFAEVPNTLPALMGRPAPYPLGLGLAVVAIGYRSLLWLRAGDAERAVHGRALFDSLVLPCFGFASPVFLWCTVAFLPQVADLKVQHAFGALGALPPVVIARLFGAVPPLGTLCTIVYLALPVGIAVVHGARLRRDANEAPRLLIAFLLIALFGYALYFVLPMVGPREAWKALDPHAVFPPAVVPRVPDALLAVPGFAPRNCLPSLHTAWALSLFLAARGRSRILFSFGLVWLVCTSLATLGLGEHWPIDLIVAVPFTFAVDALSLPSRLTAGDLRRVAVLGVTTAAWFVALTTWMAWLGAHRPVLWVLMGVTLAISVPLGLSLRLNVQRRERRFPTLLRLANADLAERRELLDVAKD